MGEHSFCYAALRFANHNWRGGSQQSTTSTPPRTTSAAPAFESLSAKSSSRWRKCFECRWISPQQGLFEGIHRADIRTGCPGTKRHNNHQVTRYELGENKAAGAYSSAHPVGTYALHWRFFAGQGECRPHFPQLLPHNMGEIHRALITIIRPCARLSTQVVRNNGP